MNLISKGRWGILAAAVVGLACFVPTQAAKADFGISIGGHRSGFSFYSGRGGYYGYPGSSFRIRSYSYPTYRVPTYRYRSIYPRYDYGHHHHHHHYRHRGYYHRHHHHHWDCD